ncbi:NAD(P)-dependent oxidoreductase [Ensifer sp. YR511]|uniref:NAD(P)-dependent oxidoreductase n=1 Tax=Ensifer sp. YR511 TaxID=1855294 RepID=UPI0008918D15|nr:NAD(P)-dependent oxidoreductase [Ensifer sp. YR511]SDO17377.1 Lactate dehydrogenase [Ensifer sp. YR511]
MNYSKSRLLVVSPLTAAVELHAAEVFDASLAPGRNMTPEEVVSHCCAQEIAAILLTARVSMRRDQIDRLPGSVRIIATCSVGYDHVDVAAASERGIVVTNTPEVLTGATADMTMLHILAAARRAREYATTMDQGWRCRLGLNEMLGTDLADKTLGIVGMGRIGRAVALRASAFGMRVAYHDLARSAPDDRYEARFYAELHEMLPECHVLTLHAPGGGGGPLIGARELALLPQGSILVNVARGELVDEEALIEALVSGQLQSAGLDVFRSEPDYNLRLRDLPNVFLTPHMASATQETRDAMGFRALDNIAQVLAGGEAQDAVISAHSKA